MQFNKEYTYLYSTDLDITNSVKGKVVPVFNLIKHYALKAYGGVDV
jgi:hypothetical protein